LTATFTKARVAAPGKVGSVPQEYSAELVRTFISEGVLKFGRAACAGSSGEHAKVFSGAGCSFAGVPLISYDAAGVNTYDSVAKTIGQYEDKDVAGLMQVGFCTVFVEDAVTEQTDVRVRHTQEAATAGWQAIELDTAIVGSAVPEIPAETYDLDVTVDGGSLHQLAFALVATDDWDGVAAKIQTALRTATGSTEVVAVVDGALRVTSASSGDSSTILIAPGTAGSSGGDFVAAIQTLSTTGSQAVSSAPTAFVGATVPGLAGL